VNEGCTNCVEHAYRGHGLGTTLLEVKTVDGEVRARITDQGSWKPPAINPGNSGRGLILMRAISDTMEINSSSTGTIVDITFRLPAAPAGDDDWSGGR
jgi:anti-sigma regulatory factor (Ser/Thr protein kinase)